MFISWSLFLLFMSNDSRLGEGFRSGWELAVDDYVSSLASATKDLYVGSGVISHEAFVPGMSANSRLYMIGSIDEVVESSNSFKRFVGRKDKNELCSVWFLTPGDERFLAPFVRVYDDTVLGVVEDVLPGLHERYSSVFGDYELKDLREQK